MATKGTDNDIAILDEIQGREQGEYVCRPAIGRQCRASRDATNVPPSAYRLDLPVQRTGSKHRIHDEAGGYVLEPRDLRDRGTADIAVDRDEGWFFKHGGTG